MEIGYKKVLTNSVLYSICSILTSSISFVMLPLYTRNMATDQYGVVAVITSFTNVVVVIVTLSISTAIFRYISGNKDAISEYYCSITWICFIITALFLGIALVMQDTLSVAILGGNGHFYPYLFWGIISVFVNIPYNIYGSFVQAMQRGKVLSVMNLARTVIFVALNIVLVLSLHMEAWGMILSTAIVNGLMSFVSLIMVWKEYGLKSKIDFKLVLPLFKYSVPLIPHSLSSNVAVLITKSIMNNSQSLSSTGIYSIALQIGVVMDTVQSSINNAFRPWFNEHLNDKGGPQGITNLARLLFSFTCIMFVGASLFAQELVYIMTDDAYRTAWVYVPFIAFNYVLYNIYYTHILAILYDEKLSKTALVCSLSGAIANMVLDYVFIPIWSSTGAIASLFIATIIRCAVTILISRFQHRISYSWKIFAPKLILSTAAVVFGLLPSIIIFDGKITLLCFLYKAMILIITILILFWHLRKQAILRMKTLIKKLQFRFSELS